MAIASTRSRFLLLPALAAACAAAGLLHGRTVQAQGVDAAEFNERCANRLAITLVGAAPDAALAKSGAPQGEVDRLLASPDFVERWATFVNATFNSGPGQAAVDDATYFLAKHVVEKDRPWRDMFVGAYVVNGQTAAPGAVVADDAEGLGYFRSRGWLLRYAGNESEGVKLATAYRMLNNTVGFEVPATTAKPGEDRTAAGREASACRGCHYDNWFALDKIAAVLTKKQGQDANVTFVPPTAGPQQLLGKTIKDDKELVTALVDSDAWKFAQCRNVFKFAYGRPENQCEAPVFDRCVEALEKVGTLRAAVAAVVKDPSFCQ